MSFNLSGFLRFRVYYFRLIGFLIIYLRFFLVCLFLFVPFKIFLHKNLLFLFYICQKNFFMGETTNQKITVITDNGEIEIELDTSVFNMLSEVIKSEIRRQDLRKGKPEIITSQELNLQIRWLNQVSK
ncbi:MAG: hypothetical protein CDJEALGM_01571 [Ignavibacteria bacterium]|nr:hypothetical protein [Ignavibacteria bacterium]